jgi:hypothetical protein
MLITQKSIVLSHTWYRTFTHQSIVLSHTCTIVLSHTKTPLDPTSSRGCKMCNYARAFLTSLTFLTQNLEGALPPLQTTLQEGSAKRMRASTHVFFFFFAVTTKLFTRKALLFKPFFLRKTSKKSVIKRTLRARGLTCKLFYSWSAVMQMAASNRLSGQMTPSANCNAKH